MSSHKKEFSLVLGGPLYQLYLKTRLAREPLELLRRRVLFFALVTWLPPCFFSVFAGTALAGVAVPFFYDLATHVRFLICVPLLIYAERIVHDRMHPMVQQFIERGIVPPEAHERFETAISSALHWRNSLWVEVGLLLYTLTAGHAMWLKGASLHTVTWYADASGPVMNLTSAGLWYVWISMPVFQFIVFRWLYRWVIWVRFLWQVSRLPLHLVPTHPDRSGGLSFLSGTAASSAPIVIAMSSAMAGIVAGKIFFEQMSLLNFKPEILGIVIFLLLFVLAPLCLFSPHLVKCRRLGRRAYGAIASRYVEAFDQKWNVARPASEKDFLGAADIQSLADMGNSYAVVEQMHPVPFDRADVIIVAVYAFVPIAPLILTLIPLNKLIGQLLGILF